MTNGLKNHKDRTGRDAVLIQGEGDKSPRLVERKVELVEEFAFLFYRNMKKVLMENKLSQHDLLVLFALLERVNTKAALGLVGVNQSSMAKELGTTTAQMSRSCARLEAAGLLLRDEVKDICVNPAVLLKGSPKDLYVKRAELLAQGMKAIGVDSVI